jgi:shikimate dehydrogenase
MINDLLAVTGNPVLHSKSPFIFNTIFNSMKINAYYTRLAAFSAQDAVESFKILNLKGMNVTAPFKEEIMQYMDEISDDAVIIGGVNTITVKEGKLYGYNTDYIGVYQSFINQNIDITGKKTLIIGAGGAGRAAAYGMIKKNADVTIVNRTLNKAIDAARKMKCNYDSIENLDNLIEQNEIIISSLSGDADVVNESSLKKTHIVFDANYKHSRLIEKAKKVGCTIIKGESWLLNQALPAFEYFFNRKPDDNCLNGVLDKNLDKNKKNLIILNTGNNLNLDELAKSINYDICDIKNIDSTSCNTIASADIEFMDSVKLTEILRNSLFILLFDKNIKPEIMKKCLNPIHMIINSKNKSSDNLITKIINELK